MKIKLLIWKTLILTLLLVSSCKVYRNIDSVSPEIFKDERNKFFELRQIDQISQGDSLYIKMRNGNTFYIIYQRAENDSLKGLFWKKNEITMERPIESGVPFQQIESIQVRRLSSGATIGLVLGIMTIPVILSILAVQQIRFQLWY